MGQCISVPHHKLSLSRDGSTRPFYKSKPGNLSATFHVLDSSLRWDLLNVNIATEEQLMTLPGISRMIAENIIEYRQKIGGFKKVEDLALVSGVGATKLEQFRTEVCVNRRKGNGSSYNSSLTQSMESLQTNEASSRSSPLKLINVNTANVFQLMSISRMTQEMAANIVHHRERKGPFKNVDDLVKVKGLPLDRLVVVKMYLTVDPCVDQNHVNNKINTNNLYVKPSISHRRTSSAPCGFWKSRSSDFSTKDLYELISSQISRPVLKDDLRYNKNAKTTLRIASWNLQNFVFEKAKNPGVQEVICRTILENGISLIAFQEIASKEAVCLLVSELNDPHLQNVKNWEGTRGKWNTVTPSFTSSPKEKSVVQQLLNGFIYDSSKGLQLKDSCVLNLPPEKLKDFPLSSLPFLGFFKIGGLDFVVVNLTFFSEANVLELMPCIVEFLEEKLHGEHNVFLMGNFILPPRHETFKVLSDQGYSHLLPSGICTNLETQQEDIHVWSNAKQILTGHSKVISEGLSHIVIPKGWEWGGNVSCYCPVWVEIQSTDIISNSISVANGICKQLNNINGDGDNLTEEYVKNSKSHWGSNWVWKYNPKNGIACEKDGAFKENGAV